MSQDLKLIGELYSQMYTKESVVEEGFGKTLGAVALAVMGMLGAKQGFEHSANEYSQGLPSLQTPDDHTAKDKLDGYLNKVGLVKVKLDDKHLKALSYIAKNSPDPEISKRASFILDKQTRISQQH
jgi:hypothetical protein